MQHLPPTTFRCQACGRITSESRYHQERLLQKAPGRHLAFTWGALWRAGGREESVPLRLQERAWVLEIPDPGLPATRGLTRGDSKHGAHFLLLQTLGLGKLECCLRAFVTTVVFRVAFSFFPS